MTQLLDGRALSQKIRDEIKLDVTKLNEQGIHPKLSVILVGEDPASQIYVSAKEKAANACGIISEVIILDKNTSKSTLEATIKRLNQDPTVHGILLQLPLPKHLQSDDLLEQIDPNKDVDGFHSSNMGLLALGKPRFVPCTPQGMMTLLSAYQIELKGKEAVVVGTSNIVGKPMGLLLQNAGATVTFCNSKTQDLAFHTKYADILVVATGKKHLIKGDMVKQGVCVLDVGIHRNENNQLTGDVDFDSVHSKAAYITPVPGGVGPMTITELLRNTLLSAKHQLKGSL